MQELAQRIAKLESDGYAVRLVIGKSLAGSYHTLTPCQQRVAPGRIQRPTHYGTLTLPRSHSCFPSGPPQAWVKAKQASDFSIFAPFLKEWVEISREKAK